MPDDSPDYNVALKQLRKRGVATKEFTPEQAQAIADSPGLRQSSRELRAKIQQQFPEIYGAVKDVAETAAKETPGIFSKLRRFIKDVK